MMMVSGSSSGRGNPNVSLLLGLGVLGCMLTAPTALASEDINIATTAVGAEVRRMMRKEPTTSTPTSKADEGNGLKTLFGLVSILCLNKRSSQNDSSNGYSLHWNLKRREAEVQPHDLGFKKLR